MTLVERLRATFPHDSKEQEELLAEAADCIDGLERLTYGLRFEADSYHKEMMTRQTRIEGLEECDRLLMADVIRLGAMVGRLRAVLQEIAEEEFSWGNPAGYVKNVRAIANAALESER